MKLKWYDWEQDSDIPNKIKGIKFFDGELMMFNMSGPSRLRLSTAKYWMKEPDSGVIEVIAYTLGEPLEVDCRTCKHDGGQSWFPSGCTGCCADKEYENYEPLEGGE